MKQAVEKPNLNMRAEPCSHTDGEAAEVVSETVKEFPDMLNRQCPLLGCCHHFSQGCCHNLAHLVPSHMAAMGYSQYTVRLQYIFWWLKTSKANTYHLRVKLLITHLYFCSRSETLTSLMNSSMALWSVRSATVGALTRPGSGMFSFIHCSTNVSHLSDTTTWGNAYRLLLWQSDTTFWKHKYHIYHKSSSITKISATTMHEITKYEV